MLDNKQQIKDDIKKEVKQDPNKFQKPQPEPKKKDIQVGVWNATQKRIQKALVKGVKDYQKQVEKVQ